MNEIIRIGNPKTPWRKDDLCKLSKSFIGKDTHYLNLNTDIIDQKYDWYLKEVKKYGEMLVREFLIDIFFTIDPENPPSVDDLYNSAISINTYEYISKTILYQKYNEFLDNVKIYRRRGTIPSNLIRIDPWIDHSKEILEKNYEINEKNRKYAEDINEKKAILLYYENLLKKAKNNYKNCVEVKNLKRYVISLLIFSMCGVFFPLFVMVLDYNSMMKLRLFTFLVILFGWLLILVIFFKEVRELYNYKTQ